MEQTFIKQFIPKELIKISSFVINLFVIVLVVYIISTNLEMFVLILF